MKRLWIAVKWFLFHKSTPAKEVAAAGLSFDEQVEQTEAVRRARNPNADNGT